MKGQSLRDGFKMTGTDPVMVQMTGTVPERWFSGNGDRPCKVVDLRQFAQHMYDSDGILVRTNQAIGLAFVQVVCYTLKCQDGEL